MPTQFEQVINILNVILAKIRDLEERVDEYIHLDELHRAGGGSFQREEPSEVGDLFGDTPFDPADYTPAEDEIISAPMPGATRRWVSYRLANGEMDRYELQKLDERVQRVIKLSMEQEAYFQLYQGSDGEPRITAEEHIVNQVQMTAPHNNEPDKDTGL